jgi:ubiquinone/menaquinone biosynthesis C-methylase UbiE
MRTNQWEGGSVEQQAARKVHWENIYSNKNSRELSWYNPHLEFSLKLIERTGVSKTGQIIDAGAGTSTLVDDLLATGYEHITVLDISLKAIKTAQARLGEKAKGVNWIEADITEVALSPNQFDLWHDRAVFHFLVNANDRKRYVEAATRSLKRGGYLIVATFAPDGPPRCSGLEIKRHSTDSLQEDFGQSFELVECISETHRTPFNTEQQFLYSCFKKH